MIEHFKRPGKIRNKMTLDTETRFAVRSLLITLTSMIVVLVVVFLMTTNKSAQKGYTLEQIKRENEELRSQNTVINNKVTNVSTSSQIEDSSTIDSMSPTEIKQYVTEEDNRVY